MRRQIQKKHRLYGQTLIRILLFSIWSIAIFAIIAWVLSLKSSPYKIQEIQKEANTDQFKLNNTQFPEMKLIKGGNYFIGLSESNLNKLISYSIGEKEYLKIEKPPIKVSVNDFYIGKHY